MRLLLTWLLSVLGLAQLILARHPACDTIPSNELLTYHRRQQLNAGPIPYLPPGEDPIRYIPARALYGQHGVTYRLFRTDHPQPHAGPLTYTRLIISNNGRRRLHIRVVSVQDGHAVCRGTVEWAGGDQTFVVDDTGTSMVFIHYLGTPDAGNTTE